MRPVGRASVSGPSRTASAIIAGCTGTCRSIGQRTDRLRHLGMPLSFARLVSAPITQAPDVPQAARLVSAPTTQAPDTGYSA